MASKSVFREAPEPPNDDRYEVLSNRRRRYVVHALERAEQPMQIGELATQIAAWEQGTDVERVSSDARKSAYTSLQQSHLPKMDDAGVLEFDKDRGVISSTPKLGELDIYIEFVEGDQIPWHQYYLGLFATGALLLVAVWFGAWPFVYLGDLVWGALLIGLFGISALCHAYYMRRRRVGSHDLPPELRR